MRAPTYLKNPTNHYSMSWRTVDDGLSAWASSADAGNGLRTVASFAGLATGLIVRGLSRFGPKNNKTGTSLRNITHRAENRAPILIMQAKLSTNIFKLKFFELNCNDKQLVRYSDNGDLFALQRFNTCVVFRSWGFVCLSNGLQFRCPVA